MNAIIYIVLLICELIYFIIVDKEYLMQLFVDMLGYFNYYCLMIILNKKLIDKKSKKDYKSMHFILCSIQIVLSLFFFGFVFISNIIHESSISLIENNNKQIIRYLISILEGVLVTELIHALID